MKDKFTALLVHYSNDAVEMLEPVLDVLSVRTIRARSCKEAETALCQTPCPHIALTDTVLPDGNWMDVLDLAAKAIPGANVIVVSQFADVRLYLDVLDYGAFDFITQSFTIPEITHVLKCALMKAVERREMPSRISALSAHNQQRQSIPSSLEISGESPFLCNEG